MAAVDGDRTRGANGHVDRVLLAIDGSGASERLADEAIQLAHARGASLVVVTVIERAAVRLVLGRWRVDQERERRQPLVLRIVEQARTRGVAATYLIFEGDPAEMITEAAVAEEADVIVVGARHIDRLRRMMLGSVSSAVAATAPCDVVVIPA